MLSFITLLPLCPCLLHWGALNQMERSRCVWQLLRARITSADLLEKLCLMQPSWLVFQCTLVHGVMPSQRIWHFLVLTFVRPVHVSKFDKAPQNHLIYQPFFPVLSSPEDLLKVLSVQVINEVKQYGTQYWPPWQRHIGFLLHWRDILFIYFAYLLKKIYMCTHNYFFFQEVEYIAALFFLLCIMILCLLGLRFSLFLFYFHILYVCRCYIANILSCQKYPCCPWHIWVKVNHWFFYFFFLVEKLVNSNLGSSISLFNTKFS